MIPRIQSPSAMGFGRDVRSWSNLPSYPLVNEHSYWKWPIYSWFTYCKWWFSIAMLVYQRVSQFDERLLNPKLLPPRLPQGIQGFKHRTPVAKGSRVPPWPTFAAEPTFVDTSVPGSFHPQDPPGPARTRQDQARTKQGPEATCSDDHLDSFGCDLITIPGSQKCPIIFSKQYLLPRQYVIYCYLKYAKPPI